MVAWGAEEQGQRDMHMTRHMTRHEEEVEGHADGISAVKEYKDGQGNVLIMRLTPKSTVHKRGCFCY